MQLLYRKAKSKIKYLNERSGHFRTFLFFASGFSYKKAILLSPLCKQKTGVVNMAPSQKRRRGIYIYTIFMKRYSKMHLKRWLRL